MDFSEDMIEEEFKTGDEEPRSRLKRFLYAVGVIFFIIILFMSMSGLSHWFVIGRLAVNQLAGETEADLIERLGEPDYRSDVQPFIPGEGFGMVPQRLDERDEFYYLNYVIGPRIYVFHFVAPETYEKHTGQVVLGDDWVVIEYYSSNRYVVY